MIYAQKHFSRAKFNADTAKIKSKAERILHEKCHHIPPRELRQFLEHCLRRLLQQEAEQNRHHPYQIPHPSHIHQPEVDATEEAPYRQQLPMQSFDFQKCEMQWCASFLKFYRKKKEKTLQLFEERFFVITNVPMPMLHIINSRDEEKCNKYIHLMLSKL